MTGSLLAPDQVGALENALNETLTAGRLLDAYATFGHTTRSEWVRAARTGASRARPARRIVTRYWRQGRVVHERIENAPPLANRSPRPQRATEE
jgi:hypothetical protein